MNNANSVLSNGENKVATADRAARRGRFGCRDRGDSEVAPRRA